ncbi:MAG: hypothetical protein E7319_05300 [Clostridiales bacterium]|nr:hypothetical protein [Clostridiales bacterium]
MGQTLLMMDMNFRLMAEIPLYQSLMIKREYYGTGSFKLTMKRGMPGWEILRRDALLYMPERPETMLLIEKCTVTSDTVTADGTMLKGLAGRRICVPPMVQTADDPYRGFGWDRFTGDAESAYLHYAENNLTSPEDAKRQMPGLVLGENLHRGENLPWQARFDKLTDVFAQIGQATGLGWDIRADFDRRAFVFSAWQGVDRTQGTGRAVFSLEVGSADGVTRTDDATAAVTTVYAGGAGEDENRMIYSVGNEQTGLNRRENFTELAGAESVEMLTLGAQRKISLPRLTLAAQVRDGGLCRYLRDYDVGDLVSVAADGYRTDTRLIAMQETHENGKIALSATFGEAPVTLLGRLAAEKRQVIV